MVQKVLELIADIVIRCAVWSKRLNDFDQPDWSTLSNNFREVIYRDVWLFASCVSEKLPVGVRYNGEIIW